MICQKLCRNNLSKWGSLEVKFRDKLHLFCLDRFAAGSRTTTPVRTRIAGASWRLWRSCRWERSVGGSMFLWFETNGGEPMQQSFAFSWCILQRRFMGNYEQMWYTPIWGMRFENMYLILCDIGWIDEVCETIGWGWGSLTHIPAELYISSIFKWRRQRHRTNNPVGLRNHLWYLFYTIKIIGKAW